MKGRLFSVFGTILVAGIFAHALIAVAVAMIVALPAQAQTTRYVANAGTNSGDCTNATSPCVTIEYAMGQADPTDTIEIAAGTYTEPLIIDKDITLQGSGANANDATILQAHAEPGQSNNRVITIDGNFEVDLSGLIIRHGVAKSPDGQGGGIYNNGAILTITNVTISANIADTNGGGMFNQLSSPILTNVAFISNSANGGGAIYNYDQSFPTLTNVTIRRNTAAHAIGGGIANIENSVATLRNTIVWGNGGGGAGKNIYNGLDSSSQVYYSLYGDGPGEIVPGGGFTAESSITDDPIFWEYDGYNELYLAAQSPAIDAGDPKTDLSLFFGGPDNPVDLGGRPRVRNDAIDIGTYEWQPPVTRYVNSTGVDSSDCSRVDSPCASIAYAMEQADPGNSIDIGPGAYTESITVDKSITLHGAGSNIADGTIIQAHSEPDLASARVIAIDGNFEVSISDLTIRHGVASGSGSCLYGGGIYNQGATLNISDTTIRKNSAHFGGGIYSTNLELENVTFSDNSAQTGGGMWLSDIFDRTPSTLTNVTFSGNMAGGGGGLRVNGGAPLLLSVDFNDNTAGSGAGMESSSFTSPVLKNVRFVGNSTSGGGGGMYNIGNSSPRLLNVHFLENIANFGGGMSNSNSSSPVLTNVTFSGNAAHSEGGGIINWGNSTTTMRNTIIWGNTAEDGGNNIVNRHDSSTELYYSLYGNGPDDIVEGEGLIVEISLTEDPLFMDAGNGNLRLKWNSPAVDKGDPYTDMSLFPHVPYGGPVDLSGFPRVINERVDIGAYETDSIFHDRFR